MWDAWSLSKSLRKSALDKLELCLFITYLLIKRFFAPMKPSEFLSTRWKQTRAGAQLLWKSNGNHTGSGPRVIAFWKFPYRSQRQGAVQGRRVLKVITMSQSTSRSWRSKARGRSSVVFVLYVMPRWPLPKFNLFWAPNVFWLISAENNSQSPLERDKEVLMICVLNSLACKFLVNMRKLRAARLFLCLSDALLCTWRAS